MATPFEGPEKKLELILKSAMTGLRQNRDGRWDRVVRASGASVISTACTETLDAYLLSESSLFVWEDRILMITCGQTSLVEALPVILEIVDKDDVALLFYERKNLMYPNHQLSDFEAEAGRIGAFFPGKSYRLGPANHDHVHIFYSTHASVNADEDATLELLMHDLHPDAALMYTPECGHGAGDIPTLTGIDCLYPEMTLDAYLFEPFGFSLNATCGASYFTIHVTPQASGSYASFETNLVRDDYADLVARVLGIFRPGRFSYVLTSASADRRSINMPIAEAVTGYRPVERSFYELDCGYHIRFSNFLRT
jgi:S-adenosylmethionine decarboxylase